MLTPQEVSTHSFSKASFGGYNMAMVDEFLDRLTADYTALFKENALLKTKMKSLTDTIEEYRSTESAMRKALLAAQQMADDIVKDAEEKRSALVTEAEEHAKQRATELASQLQEEEGKLASAKGATATYIARVKELFSDYEKFVDSFSELTPPPEAVEPQTEQAVSQEAESSTRMQDTVPFQRSSVNFSDFDFGKANLNEKNSESSEDDAAQMFPQESELTRRLERFSDLKFGKDFEID
jgi:cell division initiation protein